MTDDLPQFTSVFPQATEDGAAPSPTPTPAPEEVPTEPLALIGHQLQTLANLFDVRFTCVESELQHLGRKVDSPTPPAQTIAPPPMHESRAIPSTPATRCPHAAPDALNNAPRPALVRPDGPSPTGPTTRQPDAHVDENTIPRVDDVQEFPPLAPTSGWTKTRPKVTFAQVSSLV